MRLTFILLTMALLGAACGNPSAPSSAGGVQGDWQLVSVVQTDGTGLAVPNPEAYTIRFTPDGQVAIGADYNQCNGSYTAEGTTLTLSPLACTRAFCGPDSLFVPYTAALSGASAFERTGTRCASLPARNGSA
jgi:heat shock protein HslJ